MYFVAVERRFEAPLPGTPCVVLEHRPWDDYGRNTLFHAYYVSHSPGEYELLGRVKILRRDKPGRPDVLGRFESLPPDCCSLGQTVEYYDRLHAHGEEVARQILTTLRDIAIAPELEAAFAGFGLESSLLRFPNAEVARTRARSLFEVQANEDTKPLEFTFTGRMDGFEDDHRVGFTFPRSNDQIGRIMAIAGRNGTGKTQLVARLAQVLSGLGVESDNDGRIDPPLRTRVVVVSFNAFDRFKPPRDNVPGGDFSYYGLRTAVALARNPDGSVNERARPGQVDVDYAFFKLTASLFRIWTLGREHQRQFGDFLKKVGFFENEPGLQDPFAQECHDRDEMERRLQRFTDLLQRASSGHQLLVFIVTAMVESVRKRAVILLDEPETHLHPRLLSTLVRALYEMLAEREAYAIITTHSPILLQEIPGRSVRLLRLEGRYPIVKHYPGESFGEDLDVIVREAFGVAEEDRSYATILKRLVDDGKDKAEIEERFNGLGLGARMLLRDLLQSKGEA